MREIKFRGQFVYAMMDGSFQWVYGDLRHMDSKIGKHCIITEGGAEFEVLAGTVGQFTGLHDKNGKEIYEGDIVQFNQKFLIENTLRVGYEDSHRGGFSLCTKEGYYGMFGDAWLEPFYCEVIGNIHDNPELLKGGKK